MPVDRVVDAPPVPEVLGPECAECFRRTATVRHRVVCPGPATERDPQRRIDVTLVVDQPPCIHPAVASTTVVVIVRAAPDMVDFPLQELQPCRCAIERRTERRNLIVGARSEEHTSE